MTSLQEGKSQMLEEERDHRWVRGRRYFRFVPTQCLPFLLLIRRSSIAGSGVSVCGVDG